METAGQAEVVLLRPGRGEARYADGERATGESEPRRPKRWLWSLSLIVYNGPEGIVVDGLAFEIGFVRGECIVDDAGNRGRGEVEPRNLRDG